MAMLHRTGRSHDLASFSGIAAGRARSVFVSLAVRAVFPHHHALRADALREARAAAQDGLRAHAAVFEQSAS